MNKKTKKMQREKKHTDRWLVTGVLSIAYLPL